MGIIALIACAVCLYCLARRLGLAWTEAILTAAVLWGALLTLITEALSVFHAISAAWLTVCWIVIAAAALVASGFFGVRAPVAAKANFPWRRAEVAMLPAAAGLVILLAVIGFISAPSNSDSMTYHLPRVMHWMLGRSVAHYRAAHEPQLYQPPWAEFAVLHLFVLTGSDRLAFAVQWISMLVCVAGVVLLADRIGAGRRGQAIAAAFAVTVPGIVLQAYSTQNNLSLGMWLICALAGILAFAESEKRARQVIAALFGASIGLAMLTKGTAYVFAMPLLVWFAVAAIRRAGARGIIFIAIAGIIAASINLGHWSRNWRSYGSALMPADQAFLYRARVATPQRLASNVIRNLALNLRTGIATVDAPINRAAAMVHHAIGVDESDPATTFPGHSLEAVKGIGEDVSGNPLHLLLLLASGVAVLVAARRRRRPEAAILVALVAAGFLLFCFALKWQMFHARLLVPLFILGAPFVGLTLEQVAHRTLVNLAMAAALAMAFALVVVNPGHPLIGRHSIFRLPREAQYFANRPELYVPYRKAADLLAAGGCSEIGITTGSVWEYPLWIMLHSRTGRWPRIVPVRSVADADPLCAVLALPPGPGLEGVLPASVSANMIPLGGGVSIAIKPHGPAINAESVR